jgi:hypothetical protein
MAAKTCYAIVKEERLETAETKVSLVVDSTGTFPLSFSTLEETKAWVRHVIEHDEHNIRRTFSATETVHIGVDLGAPPSPPPIASTRTCDLLSQPYAEILLESLQRVRCLPVRYLCDRPI